MIRIAAVPVGFPAKEANGIEISIITFGTDALTCDTYYKLLNKVITTDEDGAESSQIEVLATGNYSLTEQQYASWGSDNLVVEDAVLDYLTLTRI